MQGKLGVKSWFYSRSDSSQKNNDKLWITWQTFSFFSSPGLVVRNPVPNLFAMSRSSDDPPDSAEDEDLESIYSRIRELEQSIVTLGMTF